MTNEQFQELVLAKLQANEKFQETVIAKFEANEKFQEMAIAKFEANEKFQEMAIAKFEGIETDIAAMRNDITALKDDVSVLKDDVSVLKDDVAGIKIQLNETNQIVKAVRHSQEFTNARMEGIELTTAKVEFVKKVQNEVNVLGVKVYDLAVAK